MRLCDYGDVGGGHSYDFAKTLDNLRKEQMWDIGLKRKSLAASGDTFRSDDLCADYEGRFSVLHRGIRFECFAKPRDGADRLHVFFSGSRLPDETKPIFNRWSYYAIVDGHTLSIDDPMPALYDEIGLGWYYGTKDENYCEYVAEIVCAYAEKLGVARENIVFVGSSGGGFAALYCACIVEGATAIAINSQIRLSEYSGAAKFPQVVGVDLSLEEPYRRTRLDELIADSTKSRFIVAVNVRSDADMKSLHYLERALSCEEMAGYGVTRLADHVLTWLYDAPAKDTHGAQEWKTMFYALDLLAQHFDDAEQIRDYYLVFSELWHDRYVANRTLEQFKGKLEMVSSFASLPKSLETAITTPVFEGELVCGVSESDYNYSRVPVDFKQGTYAVSVDALPEGEQSFGVLVMNIKSKEKVYCHNRAEDSHLFVFNIDSPSQEYHVFLYPYAVGKTRGKKIKVHVSVRREKKDMG